MLIFNFIFVLFLSASPLIPADIQSFEMSNQFGIDSPDLYEAGVREREKGNWKGALNIWLKAKTNPVKNTPDPRIGFAFIEVVTEKNAEQYFELANTMYFWGIESEEIERYKDSFRKELLRLQPIIDRTRFFELEQSFKKSNANFTVLLREFWLKEDPFPSSSYNERLIEHWSRIAYARANYTYANDTIYETDDRGLIYVRFGKPHKVKKRNVSINRVIDPVTGARIDLFNNVSFDFEVWYYFFDGEKSPTSFAFGRPGTGGSYGLQPGILSMIPIAGNRISSYYDEQKSIINTSQQLNKGRTDLGDQQNTSSLPSYTPVSREGSELMIKYAVLEDIGAIDPFYNELYNQMTKDIIRAELTGSGEKFTKTAQTHLPKYDHKEISASLLKERESPASISETKSNIEHLAMIGNFYRFLDSDFKPMYMFVTEPIDFTPIILHLESDSGESSIYQLNTLYEYDDQWRLMNEQPHIIPLNDGGHFGKGIYYFSAPIARNHVLFESQFLDRKTGSSQKRIHQQYNAAILASTNKQELEFPEKLSLDPTLQIQLSDIILGVSQPEETQNRVPFTPNISSLFEKDQEIIVYFEIYNLSEDHEYQVEYFFEEFVGKKQKKVEDKGSIILNYESASKLDKKWFTANLSDLKGDAKYNLVIKLSIPGASKTITRRVPFSTAKK